MTFRCEPSGRLVSLWINGHAGTYWGTRQPLFNATYRELYNHSSANCSALGGSICYSEINIVGDDIPPHGSRLFRLTAAPSLWIPNTGTAAKSIVLNSSGFYPGNEPWKLVDGACGSTPAVQQCRGSIRAAIVERQCVYDDIV